MKKPYCYLTAAENQILHADRFLHLVNIDVYINEEYSKLPAPFCKPRKTDRNDLVVQVLFLLTVNGETTFQNILFRAYGVEDRNEIELIEIEIERQVCSSFYQYKKNATRDQLVSHIHRNVRLERDSYFL